MTKKNMLIILLIFIIMFGLNSLTPMMYGDDYVYAFIWPGQSLYSPLPEHVMRVNSVSDILVSQWGHYFTGNGRAVAHLLIQFFVWQEKYVFNLLNSFIFVLLVLEIYWTSNYGIISLRNLHAGILCLIFFSLWSFTVNFGGVFLWISGACNYLWMTVLLLSFLMLYVRKYSHMDRRTEHLTYGSFLVFLWGTAAGWTNENTVCWIILILGLWIFKNRNESWFEPWMWYGLAGLCAGYALMIFSPGNAVRVGYYVNDSVNIWSWPYIRSRLITFGIIEFFEVFLWFYIFISFRKLRGVTVNKTALRQLALVKVCCALNLLCNGIMLFTPEFPARSGFESLVFLIIAVVILIRIQPLVNIKFTNKHALKFIGIVSGCYFLITMSATYIGMYSTYQYDKNVLELVKQHKEAGVRSVLVIPSPSEHSEVLLNSSGRHLIRPCLKENEYAWENVAFARYYKIKGIRVINRE